MEAARKLKRHVHGKIREKQKKQRKKAVEKYVEQLSQDLSDLAGYKKPEKLKKELDKLVEEKYIG